VLLTSFDPFAEFDRLAQRALGTTGTTIARPHAAMRMDAVRQADGIVLRFDLPGIDPDSIEVTVDRGVLTVSAKRAQEYAEGEKPFIRERITGSFTRKVYLSDAVDADHIEAGFDTGVLTVRVPVPEQAKARKIEVRTDAKAIKA
jgi:HSP20 family protein